MRASRLMSLGLIALLLTNPVHADPPRNMGYTKPSSPSVTHTTPSHVPDRADDNRASRYGFTKPPAATPTTPTPQPQGDTRFGFTKPPAATPPTTPTPPPTPQPQGDTRFGFTKPPAATPTPPPTPQPQGDTRFGFTKPGTTPTVVQPAPTAVSRSAADQAIIKGQSKSALAQFDADQKRYTAPPIAAPTTPQAAKQSPLYQQYGNRWNSADDYLAARRASEARLPPQVHVYYQNPPQWVSQGPPAFGNLSAGFMGAALGMIGTSAWDNWMYSHRRDQDYMEWHRYMQQKAETDPDVQAKLSRLDTRIAELEAEKAPVTNALPDGVDPSLVVAPHTVLLATASSGSHWWWWVPIILLLLVGGFILLSLRVAANRRRIA